MKSAVFEGILAAAGIGLMGLGVGAHLRGLTAAAGPSPAVPSAARAATVPGAATFAVVDARVFDGRTVLERATVLVEAGAIKAVGPGIAVPKGTPLVNAFGKTLLPGLIDAHTHAYQDALERALVFGVTTEVDMFTDVRFAADRRAEQKRGLVTARADLVSSGTLVTAPGGHGTEFGIKIPTLTGPAQAQAFVDARVAEGSDFIKIIYDDGKVYGLNLPALARETMSAVVAAAHARGKLAVVHIGTSRAAREVIEAGADGLAHIAADVAEDSGLVRLMTARGSFVIPTLSVIAGTAGGAVSAKTLSTDPAVAVYVGDSERRSLNTALPSKHRNTQGLANAQSMVRAMRVGGITILAGTDAPNPGTAHGLSLHEELELLVGAGLSPVEALASATSVPARIFGLRDRGRIAAGLRADMVLVDGDPTANVAATRRIAMVWKGGVAADRKPAIQEARPVPVDTDGLVSDFEAGVSASFGFGWQVSTDSLMGGASEASMRVVPGGAQGSRGSLEISGSVKPGSMYPWAGPMFFPGPKPMVPANLSQFKTLRFWAKGDGGTYRVLVFATRFGQIPAEQRFVARPAWQEVVVPLAAFGNGMDGGDLQGLLFSASAGQTAFRLQIDDVRFK
jgi:imidazolonepropionase-like amidohydrolase